MGAAAGATVRTARTATREAPRGDAGGDGALRGGDDLAPRQRIIEAAIAGLTALDPAALSIGRICEQAAVTPPTLYYHFGSKDGLVAEAVDSLVTRWIEQLDMSVDRQAALEQTLDQAVVAWQGMITAPQRPFAVFVWVSMWSPESRAALVRAREHAATLIRDTIVDCVGPVPGAEDLAALLLDGVLAAAVDYQLDSDTNALHRRLSTLTSVVRLSVQSHAPQGESREPR